MGDEAECCWLVMPLDRLQRAACCNLDSRFGVDDDYDDHGDQFDAQNMPLCA